jgi:hypothetical protein
VEHKHLNLIASLEDEDFILGLDDEKLGLVHIAAFAGNVHLLVKLYDLGAPVDTPRAEDGSMPVHLAAAAGHGNAIRFLVETCRATTAAPNNHGWTPTHVAARAGHGDALKMLHRTGGASYQGNLMVGKWQGWNPLHCAADAGHLRATQVMIECSADLEIPAGVTSANRPVHLAAASGHLETLQALVAAGASAFVCNGEGHTPEHLAANGGHGGVYEWLHALSK